MFKFKRFSKMKISAEIANEIKNSSNYKNVVKIIKENRLTEKRAELLDKAGYELKFEVACGTGGVGNIIVIKGIVYVQYTYGHGRCNYANVARIGIIPNNENNPITRDYFLADDVYPENLI